eukprot:CAMPEP_0115282366 /NCGR_PEP_ID=MMETSP0270-20121206/59804_1 /TAXON_ID=71861 /ORGANISM="Scrippsiella trochoidea, Strain CCMP3099" /LENGTH=55 /DNA_ID=CAMNT_0002699207 /DNA_START=15 /DNA_END=179 /DNA_ORIENTATION=-
MAGRAPCQDAVSPGYGEAASPLHASLLSTLPAAAPPMLPLPCGSRRQQQQHQQQQ